MRTGPNHQVLADLLPGTWSIAATNFPVWLNGERSSPSLTYELVGTDPLVLTDTVEYTIPGGEVRQIAGTNTWRHDGFVWHGKRWQRFVAGHWTVAGVSEDGTIAVIRSSKSLVKPAGLDIVVRDGHHYPELRRMIAHETDLYGLSSEDFASLAWLA